MAWLLTMELMAHNKMLTLNAKGESLFLLGSKHGGV
jgi:hypothetical protein